MFDATNSGMVDYICMRSARISGCVMYGILVGRTSIGYVAVGVDPERCSACDASASPD